MSPPHTCVCLLLAMVAVKSCGARFFRIEAESTKANYPKEDRSNASNKTDVRLLHNEMLSFKFCLNVETNVIIENVMFSNDGGADKCALHINGIKAGEFESTAESNYSQLWNNFKSSGNIGSTMALDYECNTITLFVTSADDNGIEIDHIDIFVEDAKVTEDIFRCNFD
ncbi:hypothetical protein SNE40_016314 [Patella caerulea]|uniref:Uncharacterized protein n=1 Tax=Patella caerulea TaxID=87958 RepID=A0AAN8J9P5_PATCE